MVRRHLPIRHSPAASSLENELSILSPDIRRALFAAVDAYEALGIRFALAGGLAAGSYGEPRATHDIDFLVGDEAFKTSGPIVTFAVDLPLQVYRTAVDPIPLPEDRHRHEVLEAGLSKPAMDVSTGRPIPILPAVELAYMKLASSRSKDRGDVASMIYLGAVSVDALQALVAGDEELTEALDKVTEELEDW